MDIAGNLYGTTSAVDKKFTGTVFELIPNAKRTKWRIKELYQFCKTNCEDGTQPSGLTYAGASSGIPYDGVSPPDSANEADCTGREPCFS